MKSSNLGRLETIIESLTYNGSFLRSDGVISEKFIDISSIPTVPGGIGVCTEVLSSLMRKLGVEKIAIPNKSNNIYFATHVSHNTGINIIMTSISNKVNQKEILGVYEPHEKVVIFSPIAHIEEFFKDMVMLLRSKDLEVDTIVTLIRINEEIKMDLEKIGVCLVSVFEFNKNTGFKLEITEEYKNIVGAR